MRRIGLLLVLLLLLAACPTPGTTTTRRPAVDKPTIEPDGTFWDAVSAAEKDDPGRLRFLLSTRFVHRGIMPDFPRNETRTPEDFDREEARLREQLLPYAVRERELVAGYLRMLRERIEDNFVHTEQPVYDISYRGEYNAARGPNRAKLTVTFRPKRLAPADAPVVEPFSMVVSFVQDHEMWRIDGFEPDPLKGAFTR